MKKYCLIILSVTFLLLLNTAEPAFSSSRRPSESERCNKVLRLLVDRVNELMAEEKVFPKSTFRIDPKTGLIPLDVLEEQALVSSWQDHASLLPNCRYALAPWALSESGMEEATGYDCYCLLHGFREEPYNSSRFDTAEELRNYFIAMCTKNGIDPTAWQQTIDALDPDVNDEKKFRTGSGSLFNRFIIKVGAEPILLVQLLLTIVGSIVYWKRSGDWKANFWAGATAGAALWVGLQTVYLLLTSSMVVDPGPYYGGPKPLKILFAVQISTGTLLLFYFMVMIFKFPKYKRPQGPVIAMTFVTFMGIFCSNAITGLTGLLAFRAMLANADNRKKPAATQKPAAPVKIKS